jgi:PAS domain S-box-containing protein
VGQNGKWIWFTAAPIKAPDGKIVSAIETLWDKTEDRKVDEERQHHTNELAALCSIYSALSAPWLIEDRIDAALKEIKSFMRADDICLFLRNESGDYLPKRHIDRRASPDAGLCAEEEKGSIRSIAENGEVVIAEEHPKPPVDDSPPSPRRNTASTAFIPIGSKGKKNIGVLRIVGRKPRQFPSGEKHVLELIGNRIGVAIENALLQEQYVKSEEKYRSLFDNDPNPIFIIDQHRLTIVDINERVCVCYGYSREELRNFPFVRLGDSDDPEVETGLAGLRLGRSILFSKKRHYRKAGTPFFVNINASHARYGETDVLIVATTDITEAVEKETQLIQASKMTTLGLMAAGMAHEINQPLNVIQVYADLFLKSLNRGVPLTDEELRTMVKEITANIERATGIIRHVRDFARQSEVLKNRIDINAPVRDVFKVLGNQIKVHQIEMRLNLAPELPPILADHNRLEQVFINLVTNAIDAMDDKAELSEHRGMVKRLDISTFAEADHVVVVVEDNGIGMSEAVKNKIFEPFFTTKKVGRGTGLGVSISYGIVKDYDGTIDIRSRPLQGTRFMIKFPAAPDTRSVSP